MRLFKNSNFVWVLEYNERTLCEQITLTKTKNPSYTIYNIYLGTVKGPPPVKENGHKTTLFIMSSYFFLFYKNSLCILYITRTSIYSYKNKKNFSIFLLYIYNVLLPIYANAA